MFRPCEPETGKVRGKVVQRFLRKPGGGHRRRQSSSSGALKRGLRGRSDFCSFGSGPRFAFFLQAMGGLAENTVLVLTTFDGPEASELGSPGQKAQTRASRPIEASTPAVDISIVDKDSFSAQEVQVRTPIFVRIAEVAPEPNWICVARAAFSFSSLVAASLSPEVGSKCRRRTWTATPGPRRASAWRRQRSSRRPSEVRRTPPASGAPRCTCQSSVPSSTSSSTARASAARTQVAARRHVVCASAQERQHAVPGGPPGDRGATGLVDAAAGSGPLAAAGLLAAARRPGPAQRRPGAPLGLLARRVLPHGPAHSTNAQQNAPFEHSKPHGCHGCYGSGILSSNAQG